jgi:hypothetical protein
MRLPDGESIQRREQVDSPRVVTLLKPLWRKQHLL